MIEEDDDLEATVLFLIKEVNKLKRQVAYLERVVQDNDLDVDEERRYAD